MSKGRKHREKKGRRGANSGGQNNGKMNFNSVKHIKRSFAVQHVPNEIRITGIAGFDIFDLVTDQTESFTRIEWHGDTPTFMNLEWLSVYIQERNRLLEVLANITGIRSNTTTAFNGEPIENYTTGGGNNGQ